jgi:hypothetical protein
MRYMIMVRATADTEAGRAPPDAGQLMADMNAFHEELARAGALLDGAGLQPSAAGFRVQWDADGQRVLDGPFAESKELIAGYTLIQVRDREEALAWARRFPNPMGNGRPAVIEVRPLYEQEQVEALVASAATQSQEVST